MTRFITYIRQHLSLRLGLLILVVVGGVFVLSLGLLFRQTKHFLRQAAERHALQVLDETIGNINGIMDRTEAATADMERLVQQHIEPDSLLAYSRRMLEQHPDILGFTVALEPYYFPEYGRLFSAYSLRRADSIQTVVESHDYLTQDWYRMPYDQQRALWMEPYIDDLPGETSSNEYNYSFVKPLYTLDGRRVGVLCTDLLLKWLSAAVTEVKPFPNSSAIMLGHDGHYIVHPDTTKLVKETIFSDPDPKTRQDIIPLGQAMIAGQSGMWAMVVDGQPAHLFYRPLERTGWSIAIVCPDSDVFSSYNHTLVIVWIIIGFFLLLLLLFCYHTIRRAIIPINQLAATTRRMADGEFDVELPPSPHPDTIGKLQNSFFCMQKNIQASISNLQSVNAETEQRNKELQQAYELVHEADQRKTEFIREMTHQIRTPLNIINGFTQVIAANHDELPSEELADITARMRESAKDITHITRELTAMKSLSPSPPPMGGGRVAEASPL